MDNLGSGSVLHALHAAAAGIEVSDDIAHVVLGNYNFNLHHRLKQYGIRLAGSLLEMP